MGKLLGTHVDGPLASHVPGFLEEFKRQHYADWSATAYQGVMAHLSRWLEAHHWPIEELTPDHIQDFVAERRRLGYAKGRSTRGMVGVLVTYLRKAGAIPAGSPPVLRTPQERVVDAFEDYLANQRGLTAGTIRWYRVVATKFLAPIDVQGEDPPFMLAIAGPQVNHFLQKEARLRGVGSFHNVTVALRSLLRFLFVRGWMSHSMVGTIPSLYTTIPRITKWSPY